MDIRIEHAYLIMNRLTGPLPAPLKTQISSLGIPLLGVIPADEELARFEYSGRPLVDLTNESPVYQAVAEAMGKIL